jgi:hypothetical protein
MIIFLGFYLKNYLIKQNEGPKKQINHLNIHKNIKPI